MITLHVISEHFPPEAGGLELWTKQLADALSADGWARVIVYVTGEKWPRVSGEADRSPSFEVTSIAAARSLLLEPVHKSSWPEGRVRKELDRATYLCLLTSIRLRVSESPVSRHVLLSNFATGVGFIAGCVAESLGLPHVVRLAGTDWSRGMRTAAERNALLDTLRSADHVVVLNGEQRDTVVKHVPPGKVTLIFTSLNTPFTEVEPCAVPPSTIELFADCGFSHKKATQLLLLAFATVAGSGQGVRLTVAGGDEPGQEVYWESQRNRYQAELGDAVQFPGALSRSEVMRRLHACNLYCSATLAEGCSLGRIAALCVGIPILTTASGEMPDVASAAGHVKLVPPGDLQAFAAALSDAIERISLGTLKVDDHQTRHFRTVFSPTREVGQWKHVLASV